MYFTGVAEHHETTIKIIYSSNLLKQRASKITILPHSAQAKVPHVQIMITHEGHAPTPELPSLFRAHGSSVHNKDNR